MGLVLMLCASMEMAISHVEIVLMGSSEMAATPTHAVSLFEYTSRSCSRSFLNCLSLSV